MKSKKKKIKSLPMQVFYTSKEETNCPLMADLVRLSKNLKKKNILRKEKQATISFSYGKRVLINGLVKDHSQIKRSEVLEIVDYDPIRNNLLVMGTAEPLIETSIHYMIHHARKEVKVVLQINEKELFEKMRKNLPILKNDYPINSIEFIKDVLKYLKDNEIIGLRDNRILFTGKDVKEIEKLIEEIQK